MFKKHTLNSSKILFSTILGIIIFCMLHSYAIAQDITQERADSIKTYFEQKIKQTTDIQKIAGDTYKWDGDISVEPLGNYYAITLPYLKITHLDGTKLDIGMLAINAIPASEDQKSWKTAIAIPTPIRIYDKLGALEYKIDIGKQRLNGIFMSNAAQFLKLNGQVEDVTMTNAAGDVIMVLPSAHLKYDFNIVEPNIWDGSYLFQANDLKFDAKDEQIGGSIGSVFLKGNGKGLHIKAIQHLQEKMGKAGEKLEPGDIENAASNENATQSLSQIGEAIFSYLSDFGDSTSGTFGITNLNLDLPDAFNPGQTKNFKLDKAAFDVEMSNIRSNNASLLYGLQILGINMPMDAPNSPLSVFGSYVPKDISVKIKLADIPYQKLVNAFGDTIGNLFSGTVNNTAVSPSDTPNFEDIFMNSNAKLILEETYIGNDLYRFQSDVNLSTAPNSPFMLKGKALTKIFGLQELVAKLQQDVQASQDPAFQAQAQSAMQFLPMLQMFGQQQDENGKKVYVYDFDLTDNGQILLNGNDMSAMMGGGGAEAGTGTGTGTGAGAGAGAGTEVFPAPQQVPPTE